eukprot:403369842
MTTGDFLEWEEFETFIDISPEIGSQNQDYSEMYEILKMERCKEGRLKNDPIFNKMIKNGQISYCPIYEPFTPMNLQVTTLSVFYSKCDEMKMQQKNKTCVQDAWEISNFLSSCQIKMNKLSEYFDVNEFENNPIKSQLSALFLIPSQKLVSVYTFTISLDVAIRRDSMFANQIDPQNSTFYALHDEMTLMAEKTDDIFFYTAINFNYQSQTLISERKVFTLLDALANSGGIMQILPVLIGLLINKFQDYLFFQSIFNSNYKVTKSNMESNTRKTKADKKISSFIKNIQKDRPSKNISKQYEEIIKLASTAILSFSAFRITLTEFLQVYLKQLICCKKFNMLSFKEQLLIKASQSFNQETDISSIMKKLSYHQELLKLLFNKQQMAMANYLSQKIININVDNIDGNKSPQLNKNSQLTEDLSSFMDKENLKNKNSSVLLKAIITRQNEHQVETLRQKLFRGITRQIISQIGKQSLPNILNLGTPNKKISQNTNKKKTTQGSCPQIKDVKDVFDFKLEFVQSSKQKRQDIKIQQK